jgi:hypothetical protein
MQVNGYAVAVGSAALNQKRSTERVNVVSESPEWDGGVPLTNMAVRYQKQL